MELAKATFSECDRSDEQRLGERTSVGLVYDRDSLIALYGHEL